MTEPSADDADLREWFWRCALNLQNAAIKSTPQIAHPCDADHFADDAMRRIDALTEQRVAAAVERCCAAICFGCAHGWERGYDERYDPEHRTLMHKAEGCNVWGHKCGAAMIRADHPAPAADPCEQRVAAAVQEERQRCFAWALGRVPRSRTCQAIRDGDDPHVGYLPKDPSLCWHCGETLHPGHDCSALGA